MKVRAIQKGYYNNQMIEEGQTFTLYDIEHKERKNGKFTGETAILKAADQFSEKWMETLDGPSKLDSKPRADQIPGYKTPGKGHAKPSAKAVQPKQE